MRAPLLALTLLPAAGLLGQVTLTSSNLPILVINTNGQIIPDEPKIMCDLGIIWNGNGNRNYLTDSFNNYNGRIGIEMRGSSSQWFPKKPYGFETWDSTGKEINVSLLGMPPESDWILFPSYSDKSLMNNVLTYELWRDMGWYAPRTVYCELIIDTQYMGVYALMEKIKRDNDRVNIAKLTSLDNAGDALTGGYIIKVDKTTGNDPIGWYSTYPPMVNTFGQQIYFQYEYPDPDSLTFPQEFYIQLYVDSFEDAVNGPDFADPLIGYPRYCNPASFIDYFIINELARNVDGYRLSTFLYKDRYSNGQGKIHVGPVWDYDIAWGNADYCRGSDPTGWALQFGNDCPGDGWQVPAWWERMMQDPVFNDSLHCRWIRLRETVLSTTRLLAWIDSVALYLNESQVRNFAQWPILGSYVWPNPYPYPTTYQGEVDELKTWITNRIGWLDATMPGSPNCGPPPSGASAPGDDALIVSPNPFHDILTLRLPDAMRDDGDTEVKVLDMMGHEIMVFSVNSNSTQVDAGSFPPGVYVVKVSSGSGTATQQVVKGD